MNPRHQRDKECSQLAVCSELGKLATHSVSQTDWSLAHASFHALRLGQVEKCRHVLACFKTNGISPTLMLILINFGQHITKFSGKTNKQYQDPVLVT